MGTSHVQRGNRGTRREKCLTFFLRVQRVLRSTSYFCTTSKGLRCQCDSAVESARLYPLFIPFTSTQRKTRKELHHARSNRVCRNPPRHRVVGRRSSSSAGQRRAGRIRSVRARRELAAAAAGRTE